MINSVLSLSFLSPVVILVTLIVVYYLAKLTKNSPWLLDTQVMYTTVIRLPQAHRKVNSLGVRHDYNIYVRSTYIYNIDIIPIPCIPWLFASFDKIILHFFNFL